MKYRILGYSKTTNIGDYIQTIAIENMIRRVDEAASFTEIRRDRLPGFELPDDEIFVINGYFRDENSVYIPGPNDKIITAGIHCNNQFTAEWVAKLGVPVAARDPETKDLVESYGGESFFLGCATACGFDLQEKTKGTLAVEAGKVKDAETYLATHVHGSTDSRSERGLAGVYLEQYGTHEYVVTKRIHCAIPALAMGGDVKLLGRENDHRYGLATALGINLGKRTYFKEVRHRFTAMSQRFEKWLASEIESFRQKC